MMGLPAVITTDQGTEFKNKLNDELMKAFNIEHRLTTAYHPQANGLDERFNQTLTNSIVKYVETDRENWDVHLDQVVFAYNTAVQESTKYTPFQAMFGRMARIPVDINSAPNYDPAKKLQEFYQADQPSFSSEAAKWQKDADIIKKNILTAQAKQKRNYDQKHNVAECFGVGSTVLLKDFNRKKRKGGKLDFRWRGPFVIISSLGRGLFKLKELNGIKVSICIRKPVLVYNFNLVPFFRL